MAKQRIGLYIDQEPAPPGYAHAVQRVLEGQGYDVMLLEHLDRRHTIIGLVPVQDDPVADIIVMDVSLARGAVAWQLLMSWLINEEIGQKPIIVCSADLLDSTLAQHLRNRGCKTIAKPFRPQDLVRALQEISEASAPRLEY